MAQRPELQEEIFNELHSAPIDNQVLKGIPFLENLIDETLRLYGAAPGMLPREVPRGGANFGQYYIPGGVTVLTQAWTLHRDADVYLDPESFHPYRWEESTQAMRDSFMPFGAGARSKQDAISLFGDDADLLSLSRYSLGSHGTTTRCCRFL